MIQKTMPGEMTPVRRESVNELSNNIEAKKKGIAIQMPPLNTTLVEVHQDLAKRCREDFRPQEENRAKGAKEECATLHMHMVYL